MTHLHRSDHPMHLNDLLGLFPWIPAGPVCDIGCGDGHLPAAAAAYGLPILALDVSEQCIEKASKIYGERVDWRQSDVRNFRLQRESYAAIFCLDVFPFVPNGERARIMGRLKAAIKPGGLLIISGLMENDPAAREKWARGSNRISQLPTGVFQADELLERFEDWETLFYFEGTQQQKFQGQHRAFEMAQIVVRKPLSLSHSIDWQAMEQRQLGLSWGPQAVEQVKQKKQLMHLEIQAEHYLDPHQDSMLAHLCREMAVIPRAEYLSLGASQLPDSHYLSSLSRVLQRSGAQWWVTPLAFARIDQLRLGTSLPLPMTEEALEKAKHNIRCLQQKMALPLLIENVCVPAPLAQAELNPLSFLRHVAQEANCGIALNLLHFWKQCEILACDAQKALDKLPCERIIQLRVHPQIFEQQATRQLLEWTQSQLPLRALTLLGANGAMLDQILEQLETEHGA